MENERIEYLLFTYFSEKLTEEEEKELLLWLEADTENKKKMSEMANLWAIAHIPILESNKKNDFENYFQNLSSSDIPKNRKKKFGITLLYQIVASIVLILTAGILSYYTGKTSKIIDHQAISFETTVPLGSQSKVILPDRSIVWLNSGSSLKYNTNANEETRNVELIGEAYFEVEKDSLHPFIVKSGTVDIKVLGTSFNVKAYQNDDAVSVSLVSGKVNVALSQTNTPNPEIILTPNQQLVYNKETTDISVIQVSASDFYAWKDGRLKFHEKTFTQIAKEFERKYNVSIKIESEVLKNEIFSGSFSYTSSLDNILREIDVEKRYKWSENNGELVIRDK